MTSNYHLTKSIFDVLDIFFALPITLIIASFCGIFLGIEREKKNKPAGIKTISLVCLSSAIFTALSHLVQNQHGDITRIAAQIVTGIGFLGAGAIMRDQSEVKGLTTAATIWSSAAVGMIVGYGYPLLGISATLLIRFLIYISYLFEMKIYGKCTYCHLNLKFKKNGEKTLLLIEDILENFNVNKGSLSTESKHCENQAYTLIFCNGHKHFKRHLLALSEIDSYEII